MHFVGNNTQVVAYQVHYSGMLGGFFPVVLQHFGGVADSCVNRALHGIGTDCSLRVDAHKSFGREAHKAVVHPQTVWGM